MKNLVLDLFSGTGSATRPFEECGRHTVVHVDIAPPPSPKPSTGPSATERSHERRTNDE